ncbi:MAG: hypothetical protein AAGI70_03205 [Pseudomonadota bacterium]
MTKRIFAVLLALPIAACAPLTTSPLPPRVVDQTFVWDGMTWQGGGGVYISLAAFEEQGKVAVCGLRAEQDPQASPSVDLNSWATQSMRVELVGRTVFSDLAAFPETQFREDAAPAGQAKCFLTSEPWVKGFEGASPDVVSEKRTYKWFD